ncbi:hypothetical protein NDU88_005154 [Pleurodeles waltl]|uniref:Uncharacterized protein n=1 Tax=Pleurodeles waltl TaxID=8319 RepID=A0AAV7N504_PLEWA|nr:hypothetical protein NDU88_005154 [Pleurodeles waltl]
MTNARDLPTPSLLRRQLPTRSGRQPLQKSPPAPTAECSLQLRKPGPHSNNRTDARRHIFTFIEELSQVIKELEEEIHAIKVALDSRPELDTWRSLLQDMNNRLDQYAKETQ